MQGGNDMMRWPSIALAFALTAALTAPATSAERTLKCYYFSTSPSPVGVAMQDFIKRVNETGKGLVQIETPLINPSSIPPRQSGNALKNGIVDMAAAPPSYFSQLVRGAEGLTATTVDPTEQRKNGAFEFVDKLFEKRVNARFLGQYGYGLKFHVFTTIPINRLADFKGVRLRSSNTYKAFFESLGAQPVLLDRGDTFTAMERGVVKGYGNLVSEVKASGWAEITKYRIDPGFYDALVTIFVNVKVWDSLDAKQKDVLHKAAIWLETERNEQLQEQAKEAGKKLEASGIKTLTLPPDEGKQFVALANKATWDNILKQAPDYGPELKKLIFP
jgi:TRAP-type transport system periplasmic protein